MPRPCKRFPAGLKATGARNARLGSYMVRLRRAWPYRSPKIAVSEKLGARGPRYRPGRPETYSLRSELQIHRTKKTIGQQKRLPLTHKMLAETSRNRWSSNSVPVSSRKSLVNDTNTRPRESRQSLALGKKQNCLRRIHGYGEGGAPGYQSSLIEHCAVIFGFPSGLAAGRGFKCEF